MARIVKPHTVAGITTASIGQFIAARRLERGVKKVRSSRQQRSITTCLTSRPLALLRYRVIRVWQLPVEQLLASGVGTLPLAPISDMSEARVPVVFRRMKALRARIVLRAADEDRPTNLQIAAELDCDNDTVGT